MRTAPELLFVHVPRTGGTSILSAVRELVGEEELLRDYDDRPVQPESPINVDFAGWQRRTRASVADRREWPRVVAGHYWLGKYRPFFPEAFAAAWLREPVARLASIYFLWKSTPADATRSELRSHVASGELTFLELVELPLMRNQVARVYLRGYDLSELDFVGDFDSLQRDFDGLCRRLGWPRRTLPLAGRNRTDEYARFRLTAEEREHVRRLNAEDVELYAAAKSLGARAVRRGG